MKWKIVYFIKPFVPYHSRKRLNGMNSARGVVGLVLCLQYVMSTPLITSEKCWLLSLQVNLIADYSARCLHSNLAPHYICDIWLIIHSRYFRIPSCFVLQPPNSIYTFSFIRIPCSELIVFSKCFQTKYPLLITYKQHRFVGFSVHDLKEIPVNLRSLRPPADLPTSPGTRAQNS